MCDDEFGFLKFVPFVFWGVFMFLCAIRVIDFKVDIEFKVGNIIRSKIKKCTPFFFDEQDKLKNQEQE